MPLRDFLALDLSMPDLSRPDFSRRSDGPEIMDDVTIQGTRLERSLRDVARLNRLSGGHRVSMRGLETLVPDGRDELTVLDVGSGSGHLAHEIADWAHSRRMAVHVTGIDLTATTIAFARDLSGPSDHVTFEQRDLFELPDQPLFDIVHCSLVLHHFPGHRAADALAKMFAVSRLGVVVNDLHRHPLAWFGTTLATRLVSRSPMVHHDGPLSVLRGFTRRELLALARQADMPDASVAWEVPFRWLLVCPKQVDGDGT